jgi:hypothetical protein
MIKNTSTTVIYRWPIYKYNNWGFTGYQWNDIKEIYLPFYDSLSYVSVRKYWHFLDRAYINDDVLLHMRTRIDGYDFTLN